MRAAHPDAEPIELGDVVVVPGLVNAHAHLDLSYVSRAAAPGSFIEWVQAVIRETVQNINTPSYFVGGAVNVGLHQCRHFGVTSVGDIGGRYVHALRHTLSCDPTRSGIRLTSYGEVKGMAQRRDRLEPRVAEVIDAAGLDVAAVRIAISPHAPYSIEADGYRRCLEVARARSLPLTTHLAETPYEAEFLASRSGPFRDLWNWLGAWDDQVPTFSGGAIHYAKALGLLDYPATLLAHVNYCDDEELAILAAGQASVVYCPRTHRYFGHPPHRWRDMLAAGINVALGTDSCASSPDLNLLDDLRLVHQIGPDYPIDELWKIVTIHAARAIDAEAAVGSLTPGKCADFITFPVKTGEPLREIVETHVLPSGVWVGGQRLTPAAG
jgi:cytosine/adenosine deaminase-related metal-dependent hydrolase